MSKYWHLHCNTCCESAEIDSINRGNDTILAMITIGREVLAMLEKHSMGHIDLTLKVDYRYVPLAFIGDHRDHELVAVSEYGDIELPEEGPRT